MKQENTLKKGERISSKEEIDLLFQKGCSILAFPVRMVFLKVPKEKEEEEPVSVLASVPKRRFKSAVKRNRLKRLIKEAYRLNKDELSNCIISPDTRLLIAFLYIDNALHSYENVEKGMKKGLAMICNQLK